MCVCICWNALLMLCKWRYIHMYLPSMYEVLLYEGKHVTVSGGLNNNLYLLRCMIKIIIIHKVRYMYTSNWSIRNSLEVLSHIQLHVRKKGNVQTNCMTKKRWKRQTKTKIIIYHMCIKNVICCWNLLFFDNRWRFWVTA